MITIRNVGIAVVVVVLTMFWLNRPEKASSGIDDNMPDIEYEQSVSIKSPTMTEVNTLSLNASQAQQEGNYNQAKEAYQTIVNEYPDYENIAKIQKDLESLNMKIIFSNAPVAGSVMHEIVSGDTLGKLAKQYGTTIDLIKKSNNLNSDVIRLGQKLRIWTKPFNIFVDKSQNKLILKTGDEVVKVYDVSTGSNSSTPVGDFTITTRLTDPVWFNRGVVVPPESPENVLGTRWLGFNIPGYGIHGTVEPETIGQQVTAGCVRMRNSEVEELYSIIPMGVSVKIVN